MNRIEIRDKLIDVKERIETVLDEARGALRDSDVPGVQGAAGEWLEHIESALSDGQGRLSVTTTMQHTIEALEPDTGPDEDSEVEPETIHYPGFPIDDVQDEAAIPESVLRDMEADHEL